MRKKFIIVLCFLLTLMTTMPGIPAVSAGSNNTGIVRVKIFIGTPAEYSFYLDGNYAANGTGLDRQLYTVKLESGVLNLYFGSSLVCSGTSIKLVQHSPESGRNNFIWMYNTKYSSTYSYTGDMEFRIDTGNACIMAVNHVYIEDYLCGVLPYEMSESWPTEALKAQAVAARGYVLSRLGGSGVYDVVDTSTNQVFRGYNSSMTNAISAVNATAKQALTYNNAVISTYFGASNGGWTEIPLHLWGTTDYPYYQIQQDTYDDANSSSLYEKVFFPNSIDAEHPIKSYDNVTGTPNIANAELYVKQAIVNSGQLSSYGVTDVNGFTLTGMLSAVLYEPDMNGVYNNRVSAYSTIECVDFVKATASFSVNVGGTSLVLNNIDLDLRYLNASNGDTTYQVLNSSSLRIFTVEVTTDENGTPGIAIGQKRYGHGVGLSQRGAQQRANSGQSYQEILSFYYPGATLSTMTYSAPTLSSITIPSSSNASVKLTNSTPLNVRSGPGTSYSILGTLPNKARIFVVQTDASGWCQIIYGGQYAYVSSTYVQLDSSGTSLKSQANVQSIGWQSWVSNGAVSGTSGQALRLEALKIKLEGIDSIQYKAHVQNIGWQDWVGSGQLSGTEGQALRLEAVQIRLTGAAALQYDIYYRVHAQNYGWLDWAKNGASAGTAGFSYRLEAIQIMLVPKGSAAPGSTTQAFIQADQAVSYSYQSHVQSIGWQNWVSNGAVSGTSGQALRLETLKIKLEGIDSIQYKAHVQNIGWQDWVGSGQLSGTEGQGLRIEAVQIRLTGAAAALYDIYYRAHVQDIGWMDWAKNGASAGTAGFSYRLEAIQIMLVPKGSAAPGSTTQAFIQADQAVSYSYQSHVQSIGWQNWVSNGAVSGTSGQALRLEALKIKLEGIDGIQYKAHVQNIGWQDWVGSDQLSGTEGQGLRIEAVQIRLTGTAAALYDIYYRAHVQDIGWMDWARNGASAGTAGFSYRLEAIQIMLVPKGSAAPGSTANAFIQIS